MTAPDQIGNAASENFLQGAGRPHMCVVDNSDRRYGGASAPQFQDKSAFWSAGIHVVWFGRFKPTFRGKKVCDAETQSQSLSCSKRGAAG